MNRASLLLLAGMSCIGCSQKTEDDGSPDPSPAVSDAGDELSTAVQFVWDTGGSVQTNLGYGIVLNRGSSLKRVWITANDSTFPARLIGSTGIRSAYESERYSGSYQYRAAVTVEALEPLSAIEVRFPVFDVWGRFEKSLSMTEVVDMERGKSYTFNPKWRVFSENEASEYWASMAFIARVRTVEGKVVEFPLEPVLDEARRFATAVSLEDLALNETAGDSTTSEE